MISNREKQNIELVKWFESGNQLSEKDFNKRLIWLNKYQKEMTADKPLQTVRYDYMKHFRPDQY